MDIQQLRNFVVVAEQLHFRIAAERLGIAQPTLSHQIRELERSLAVRLFDRTQRTVRLTNAGQVYLAEVRSVLMEFDRATERAREAHRGQRGELIIGASSRATMGHLPRVILTFRRLYPEVALQLQIMRSAEVFEALSRGRIHLGLGRKPEDAAGICTESLWSHPYRVVLPAGRALAKKQRVRLADLHGETLVIFSRADFQDSHDQVLALCRDQGFSPVAVREIDGIEELIGLVACGFGVAILPTPWERTISLPEVVFRPIASTRYQHFQIAASWRQGVDTQLVHAFVAVAREAEAAPGSAQD